MNIIPVNGHSHIKADVINEDRGTKILLGTNFMDDNSINISIRERRVQFTSVKGIQAKFKLTKKPEDGIMRRVSASQRTVIAPYERGLIRTIMKDLPRPLAKDEEPSAYHFQSWHPALNNTTIDSAGSRKEGTRPSRQISRFSEVFKLRVVFVGEI